MTPMKRPTLLLDVDGVFADFVGGYLGLVLRVTGRLYDHAHITQWDIAAACRLTPEEKRDVTAELIKPGFCRNLMLLPGAFEGLQLVRAIADPVFVTSPWDSSPTWDYERRCWLFDRLDVRREDIIQTTSKHHVDGDLILDDHHESVGRWLERRPGRAAVLWSNYANTGKVVPGAIKTSHWPDVVNLIEAAKEAA